MFPLFVTFWLVTQCCIAGEVEKTGYEPEYGFYWHHPTDPKDNDKLVIKTTPKVHQFLLGIHHRRLKHYTISFFLNLSEVFSTDYQNIVEIRYDKYRLERIKVPRVDTVHEHPILAIDEKILRSIHPQVPEPDVDTPMTIIVYYSFTKGDCVKGEYCFTNGEGEYRKQHADEVVDAGHCS